MRTEGRFILLFAGLVALTSCTTNDPEISTLCLRERIGNYIIKWETYPPMKGLLKVYVSETPDTFTMTEPALYANIQDGVTTYITRNNVERKYFRLSFNDKHFQTVGARHILTDSLQNLRDIGGYQTTHHQWTRWGRVFRSGQLNPLSEQDVIRLKNIGIRTILDLRTEAEIATAPSLYTGARIVNIPISIGTMSEAPTAIQEQRMKKGDAVICMQDQYIQFVTENTPQFAKAFDILLDKSNYPILLSCTLGKDRVGFLTALLLRILKVPDDTVVDDYLLSNEFIDTSVISYLARNLNNDAQESIATLLQANDSYLTFALKEAEKEYGSTDKYIKKGLGLTDKERHQLKELLLTE